MKKVLLGTSALLGAGLIASPAFAADGIKLSLGGYLNTAVLVNIEGNNSGSNGHLGDNRYNDGVFADGNIIFKGQTTLDNGITVGARFDLYAEQKSGNQWKRAYGFFQGGFGELRLGASDGALQTLCVTPVGGTSNFGAFSQNQVINNAFSGYSAGVCNGVASFRGAHGDRAQGITYLTPNFGGFQLGLSWKPSADKKGADDGVADFHSGMPKVVDGEQRDVIDVAVNYTRDFSGWGIAWSGAASIAASQGGSDYPKDNKAQQYQTGLNLTFGNFSVGGAFEYYKNYLVSENAGGVAVNGQDAWVAGGGIAYTIDAWTIGAQYSHAKYEGLTEAGKDRNINTVALTGKYAMGPGINLDGTLQYNWADGDKGDQAHGGYDSFGIGLGTSFTF
jgi:predicted porin